jgi:hypothetical protein
MSTRDKTKKSGEKLKSPLKSPKRTKSESKLSKPLTKHRKEKEEKKEKPKSPKTPATKSKPTTPAAPKADRSRDTGHTTPKFVLGPYESDGGTPPDAYALSEDRPEDTGDYESAGGYAGGYGSTAEFPSGFGGYASEGARSVPSSTRGSRKSTAPSSPKGKSKVASRAGSRSVTPYGTFLQNSYIRSGSSTPAIPIRGIYRDEEEQIQPDWEENTRDIETTYNVLGLDTDHHYRELYRRLEQLPEEFSNPDLISFTPAGSPRGGTSSVKKSAAGTPGFRKAPTPKPPPAPTSVPRTPTLKVPTPIPRVPTPVPKIPTPRLPTPRVSAPPTPTTLVPRSLAPPFDPPRGRGGAGPSSKRPSSSGGGGGPAFKRGKAAVLTYGGRYAYGLQ